MVSRNPGEIALKKPRSSDAIGGFAGPSMCDACSAYTRLQVDWTRKNYGMTYSRLVSHLADRSSRELDQADHKR
jgi:hypothetical protein